MITIVLGGPWTFSTIDQLCKALDLCPIMTPNGIQMAIAEHAPSTFEAVASTIHEFMSSPPFPALGSYVVIYTQDKRFIYAKPLRNETARLYRNANAWMLHIDDAWAMSTDMKGITLSWTHADVPLPRISVVS